MGTLNKKRNSGALAWLMTEKEKKKREEISDHAVWAGQDRKGNRADSEHQLWPGWKSTISQHLPVQIMINE